MTIILLFLILVFNIVIARTQYERYASKESTRRISVGYIGKGVPYNGAGREIGQGYPCHRMEEKT